MNTRKYTMIFVASRTRDCRKEIYYATSDAVAIDRALIVQIENKLPAFHEVLVFRGSKCIFASALS